MVCMSTAEKVGQLFLVTFEGSVAAIDSPITSLILDNHIGGVVLKRENDNITGTTTTVPEQIGELNTQLQAYALTSTRKQPVPLFIGLQQEGDHEEYAAVLNGITPIPSEMAIGATWNPAFARQVGQVVGDELNQLGFNLLLGPSLDVLDDPDPNNENDLGTRTFGGDPYWVGRFGTAYIDGLHAGSDGRLAVIARHFPGYGGSDRPTNIEIATVRKSLEQLLRLDLVPFFSAANAASPVDGLLTTHIRYRGLAGNLRETTPPVSISGTDLSALLDLEQLVQWRENGGLILSDELGVRAVQRFYDPSEQAFTHRRVARDAFSAGNDLLYLSDFALGAERSDYADQLANIQDTITWFGARYDSEPAFQQAVNEAVRLILTRKLTLYSNDFSVENVIPDTQFTLSTIDLGVVSAASITLLSPSPEELDTRFAEPPGSDDNIVIFTDVRAVQQCSTCPEQFLIGATALEDQMLALYGPAASNQITEEQITSFSFAALNAYLDEPSNQPSNQPSNEIREALQTADWIIFAMLDVTDDVPTSNALKRFLAERPQLERSPRIIAMAYEAPWYLDATEIIKLDLYMGVYSHTPQAIEKSLRVLFRENQPAGSLPVSVDSLGYNLFDITAPDTSQKIELRITRRGRIITNTDEEPIRLDGGEEIEIITSEIVDYNGNPVPDDTIVGFVQDDFSESLINVINEVQTVDGIARYTFLLPEGFTGQLRIRARTENATTSDEVLINGNVASIQTPTFTPTPIPTVTPTPALIQNNPPPASTDTPAPTTAPANDFTPLLEPGINISIREGQMLLGMFVGLAAVLFISIGISRQWLHGVLDDQIRFVMWGILGGLLLYLYATLGLPGASFFGAETLSRSFILILLGGIMGMGLFVVMRPSER